MTVITQGTAPPAAALLDDIAKQCNDKIDAEEKKRVDGKKKKRTCQKLGQDKHKCCEQKIQDHIENGNDPALEGEKGYNRPRFDKKTGQPIQPVDKTQLNKTRAALIQEAAASVAGQGKKAVRKAIGMALGKTVWPDAAIVGPPKRMVDFKFACPESHRSKKKGAKKRYRPPKQSKRQAAAHNALGEGMTITIRQP